MHVIEDLLGLTLEPKELSILQMSLRGVIVFILALLIVRLGHKRFMSRMTAFDAVLGFILASVLARAINGSAAFVPTLVVGLVLVLLHRLLSGLSFYWDSFGNLVKGREDVLVENGTLHEEKLRRHKISHKDLLEEARLNGKLTELHKIQIAVLERNGKVSVISEQQP